MEGLSFSLILLVHGNRHLLPLTLDSLKVQSDARFEIILLDGEGSGRLPSISHCYPTLSIQVKDGSGKSLGEMMNLGLDAAKGKYVQFLEPGERYISQHGLSYLLQLTQETGEPQLVYSSFLKRGPDLAPQTISFSLNQELLKKGVAIKSSWFLKETIQQLGGFDGRFTHRPAFDLLCRYFLKKGMRAVYSRRVLIDSEPHRRVAKEVLGNVFETCRILFRHFGLWSALRWIFVQDHLDMIGWTLAFVKQAFCKAEKN